MRAKSAAEIDSQRQAHIFRAQWVGVLRSNLVLMMHSWRNGYTVVKLALMGV